MSITVLTGGVGGAKLVAGLCSISPPNAVVAVVNTGDDFDHLGLSISPDIDTLLYTLSGRANVQQGWGREGETWTFMAAMRELGGEDWFQLGDGDLSLHVLRTWQLKQGVLLNVITDGFAKAWEIAARVLPMSDDIVRTHLETDEGLLEFQRYFVERRCAPAIKSIRFDGALQADAAPGVVEAILNADSVVIAPSNPYLSVDPILSLPAIRQALQETRAPIVAVSPIIDGAAVKGPTAKIMEELGVTIDNQTIADHYSEFIDGLIIHSGDLAPTGVLVAETDTLMRSDEDRRRVATASLELAAVLRSNRP